jgi:protein phosphatase
MNRSEQSHLHVTASTHEGMKGKNNEDRYGVAAFELADNNHTPVLLAVLSDGIGGHRAGEIAAEIAVNRISEDIAASDGSRPTDILTKAIHSASKEIFVTAQSDTARQGMGATCACALIVGKRLFIANVGDSRIYWMHGGSIHQISTDHTWLQEALDSGLLTPDQIEGHPNMHIIRRYLGSPNPPQVETRLRLNERESSEKSEANQGMALKNGDRLLLCSDGLTDLVNNNEINSTFRQNSLETASQSLIALANQRGGHDNITLIVIQVPENQKTGGFSLRRLLLIGIGMMVAAALILAFFYGWLWFRSQTVDNSMLPTTQPQVIFPTLSISTSQPTVSPTIEQTIHPTISAKDFQQTRSVPSESNVFITQEGATLTPWPTSTLTTSTLTPVKPPLTLPTKGSPPPPLP